MINKGLLTYLNLNGNIIHMSNKPTPEEAQQDENRAVDNIEKELQYRELHSNVIRKLTKADCKRGFCDFSLISEDGLMHYFKCRTCGAINKYNKMDPDLNLKMLRADRLGTLQPMGEMLKDFIYYYGEPRSTKE